MKKILFLVALGCIILSCEKKTEKTMTITGNIKGLKKGTLFFQHFSDSTLVVLDSIQLKGDGAFTFSHEIESPEIFYLHLKKADKNDFNDRITFFGEPGEIRINTSWNTFDVKAKIEGSETHEKLMEFNAMISNFNIKELELSQKALLPEFREDSLALDSLQKLANRNLLGRYRYALNFGMMNGDSYVTPYVMLTDAKEANPKYLDSVYKTLTPEVLDSKYGKLFKEYLKK
ncbi:DUF4369 domain-containing protein [Flagellimonas sp. 389]|uniref:DUF4369 domain-containing protein n=1 Tax=Flagellimonas sp. 389 TaxID=2835862 RepID=UPI001BD51556|nr:DUF4369 domain-containing protein [Flagellimonas sp. 389]MBS9462705.1 DUF4369 domain-containing protein [Flagellimonas sp. 389]